MVLTNATENRKQTGFSFLFLSYIAAYHFSSQTCVKTAWKPDKDDFMWFYLAGRQHITIIQRVGLDQGI